ncbi:MAG: glycosyltransferase [Desulfobacteraceae bacterium]|nr:glycosyltransferase [Desulfobacteraceae bacterium]
MKLALTTMGTWGDVMPFLALARGLEAAGHDITVATVVDFENRVRDMGFSYVPIRFSFHEYVHSDDCKASLGGSITATRRHQRNFFNSRRQMLEDAWRAVQGAEGVIFNPVAFPTYHMAVKRKIPCIMASVSPWLSPTREFPYMFVTSHHLGGFLNRLTYAFHRLGTNSERKIIDEWCRQTVKTKPPGPFMNYLRLNGRPIPILYFYSPTLVPTPSDWPETTRVCGYAYLEPETPWQAPPELESFLRRGATPVYVGFGSMVGTDPKEMGRIVTSALQQAGERAVVSTGWGAIAEPHVAPESLFFIDAIPHDWIFPRVKAVVHHAGSGTVWTGLRYGKPTVACPIAVDHWFWARRIHRLGAGPPHLSQRPLKNFTAEKLAQRIRTAVHDRGMTQRAEALSRELAKENGVGNAVRFIEEQLQPRH